MKNYRYTFLLAWIMLTLVACNNQSPSGQIIMTDTKSKQFYVYDFNLQHVQKANELLDALDVVGTHAWSPDLNQIVYDCYVENHRNFCLYDLNNSTTEVLLESDHIDDYLNIGHVAWTLDGQQITFVSSSDVPPRNDSRESLYSINLQTKSVIKLVELPNNLGTISDLVWLSENELMTGFRETIYTGHILVWDQQTWIPRKIAEGFSPNWSAKNQSIVYVQSFECISEDACFTRYPDKNLEWRKFSSRLEVYVTDTHGENKELLYTTSDSSHICLRSGFTWSPDGLYLAYTEGCGEMEKSDLYIMRVADGHTERLVEGLESPVLDLSWLSSLDE